MVHAENFKGHGGRATDRTAMQPFPKPADAHPKRERHGDIVFGELFACWDLRPEAVAAGRRLFGAHWEETPGPG